MNSSANMTMPLGCRLLALSVNLVWDLVQGMLDVSDSRISITISRRTLAWSLRAIPDKWVSVSGASGRPLLAPESTLAPPDWRDWLLDATDPAADGVAEARPPGDADP